MKGIFYYISEDAYDATSGIVRKIRMQIDALKSYDLELDVVSVNQNSIIYKFIRRIPFMSSFNKNARQQLLNADIEKVEFVYIRKFIFDSQFIRLCKEIKARNSNIKLIVEIPTYPYDQEWCRLIDKPLLIKEKLNRYKLQKYVDRFVTLSEDDEIFGIKTIKTQNGIDVNKIDVKFDNTYNKDVINLIGVAVLTFWHGYDRIIKGLADYYKDNTPKKRVLFNIVGEGVELSKLKKMVSKYGLDDCVVFHGRKHGADLNRIFNESDIAIGSLGIHRLGLETVSTLKAKEYCARGIPFIKEYGERDFDDKDLEFYRDFPSDEMHIDIELIVDFYERIFSSNGINTVRDRMRLFAESNLTWEIQVQPITRYIRNHE